MLRESETRGVYCHLKVVGNLAQANTIQKPAQKWHQEDKMAVVSDDHADESYCVDNYLTSSAEAASSKPEVRWFSQEEVNEHNVEISNEGDAMSSYWACIDGFVVESIDFLQKHPGGKKKLLQTNDPSTGDTSRPFAFSFSRGRNAHFPETAKIFHDGIARFLKGESTEIIFPATFKKQEGGKLVVLGRLKN